MPQLKAAKKDLRKNARRRAVNDRWRRALRAALKEVRLAISSGDGKKAGEAVKSAQKTIDRAARHKVLHRKAADRKKSRLQKAIAKIS